ncbi:MAG: rane protein of unknown function [Hyphomicrobiales bacterium]|nr:rane protein of unknown function [Hyphomicrobiales bacterium]
MRVSDDNIMLVAAGVAFYAMLAIFPALAALISIYGLFLNPARIQAQVESFAALLPPEAMKLLVDALQSFAENSANKLNTAFLIGLALALWSAKAGMSSLMAGLAIAHRRPDQRSFLMQQFVALGLTFAAILFAILALSMIAILPVVLAYIPMDDRLRSWMNFARWPLLATMVSFGIALLYRFGYWKKGRRWRWMTWGAATATILWIAGSLGLSFYVSNFGAYDKTYGSLAAVVVLLLWFWVTALVVLVGAEIDADASDDPVASAQLPAAEGTPVMSAETAHAQVTGRAST